MKDIYKKPIFYYVLVPALLAVWPLWLFTLGLPGAKDSYKKEAGEYSEAEKLIGQILGELDPQRLDYAKAKKGKDKFDYVTAIDQVTRFCRISPTAYKLSSSPLRSMKGGQKSQDAAVAIDQIDIERLAKFLSVMRMRWVNLQCTNISLVKLKGEKDAWKADIRFVYYQ
ncbi:MAG: hypothetical protein WCE45_09765 [Sedimentisphaerales bacterium]